jgi:hypothetical protein
LDVVKNNFVEAKSNQAKLGEHVMQMWNNFLEEMEHYV